MSNNPPESPASTKISQALRHVDECRAGLSELLRQSQVEYQDAVVQLDRLGVAQPGDKAAGSFKLWQLIHKSAEEYEAVIRRLNQAAPFLDAASDSLQGRSIRLLGSSGIPETSLEAVAIQAQEEERYRLAREIHDGPAQVLANLALQIEYISKLAERDVARAREELAIIQRDLRIAVGEVRRFMYDLRPPALSQQGVGAAVDSHCRRVVERFGIAINVRWQTSVTLLASHETALFRIVQEAIQNVVKHAEATRVEVRAFERDGVLQVTVADDGRGFEPDRLHRLDPDHFGLVGMRARAQQIGAELDISSQPGKGSVVLLRLPIDQQ